MTKAAAEAQIIANYTKATAQARAAAAAIHARSKTSGARTLSVDLPPGSPVAQRSSCDAVEMADSAPAKASGMAVLSKAADAKAAAVAHGFAQVFSPFCGPYLYFYLMSSRWAMCCLTARAGV
jgi:hypothetical protein